MHGYTHPPLHTPPPYIHTPWASQPPPPPALYKLLQKLLEEELSITCAHHTGDWQLFSGCGCSAVQSGKFAERHLCVLAAVTQQCVPSYPQLVLPCRVLRAAAPREHRQVSYLYLYGFG